MVTGFQSADETRRRDALNRMAGQYWAPVYHHVRSRWGRSAEDAEDLTQEFFRRLVEADWLARYAPARGRLRTFLRVCVDRLVQNHDRARAADRRGGGMKWVPMVDEGTGGAEAPEPWPQDAVWDDHFEREWIRALFSEVLEQLEQDCRSTGHEIRFRVFERHDLDPDGREPSYRDVAAELGLTATEVTNHLAWARREFRRRIQAVAREHSCCEAEYRDNLRTLLGRTSPRRDG